MKINERKLKTANKNIQLLKKKRTKDAIDQGDVDLLDIKKYEEAKLIYENLKKPPVSDKKHTYGYMGVKHWRKLGP